MFADLYAAGWDGIVIDTEIGGPGSRGDPLSFEAFDAFFARANKAGFKNIGATTSHFAPYDFPNISYDGKPASQDGWTEYWCNSPYVKFFSPQLYTQGQTFEPEFTRPAQIEIVKNAPCRIIPSIPEPADYAKLDSDPEWAGIKTSGYIVWWGWDGAEARLRGAAHRARQLGDCCTVRGTVAANNYHECQTGQKSAANACDVGPKPREIRH